MQGCFVVMSLLNDWQKKTETNDPLRGFFSSHLFPFAVIWFWRLSSSVKDHFQHITIYIHTQLEVQVQLINVRRLKGSLQCYKCIRDSKETKTKRPLRFTDKGKEKDLHSSADRPQCNSRHVKGQEAMFGLPDDCEEVKKKLAHNTVNRTLQLHSVALICTYKVHLFSFTQRF